jgi:hypothetical protein
MSQLLKQPAQSRGKCHLLDGLNALIRIKQSWPNLTLDFVNDGAMDGRGRRFTLEGGIEGLFGAMRFLWNATRGHRLTPWRSEFLRWRVETYSGKPAETLRARDVFGFMWEQKWELLSFLFWTDDLEREARRRP